jgi:hypothetical protein
MGAFKSFEAKDIITTPFVVNKGFSFYGDSEFINSGLDKFIGTNPSGLFSENPNPNNILDYSLYIRKVYLDTYLDSISTKTGITVANNTINNFEIITDTAPSLTNETGLINFSYNETVTLNATFTGNFRIQASGKLRYLIYNCIMDENGNSLFVDSYTLTFQNGLFTHSWSINQSFNLQTGDSGAYDTSNLYIYSFVLVFDSNGNQLPSYPVLFRNLSTSFEVTGQSPTPANPNVPQGDPLAQSNPLTGINNNQYQKLIYNSVKQLYYTNYIGNPYPNPIYYTGSGNYAQFDNYLQSYPLDVRYFPTESSSTIGVFSIPSKIYGEYIKPGSFLYQSSSVYVYDDGEGNLFNSIDNTICGNIIYSHGLAIITTSSQNFDIFSFISSSYSTCSFSSSLTLFETQYKCNIKENEFNFSQNPSIISGSNGDLYKYAISSYFDPYITTVGLYNENQDLIAVAKLSQPLPSSRTTDTNIIINLDK